MDACGISGVDKWSGDYSVVVAGFDDESDYAIVSKIERNVIHFLKMYAQSMKSCLCHSVLR